MDITVLIWYQSSGSQHVSLILQDWTTTFIIPGQMDSTKLWSETGWQREDLERFIQMERALLRFFEISEIYI
jgi:hypothetical protein